jgi:hypothetical protein
MNGGIFGQFPYYRTSCLALLGVKHVTTITITSHIIEIVYQFIKSCLWLVDYICSLEHSQLLIQIFEREKPRIDARLPRTPSILQQTGTTISKELRIEYNSFSLRSFRPLL